MKANELNIMVRGGAGVVQAHLNIARKNAASQAGLQAAEQRKATADAVKKGKTSTTNLTSPAKAPAPGENIESLVTSGSVPPVDLVRLVEWLNQNQHSIQARNHLRNPKNLFNVTHGTQLSEMKRIMKSDRYFLRAQ